MEAALSAHGVRVQHGAAFQLGPLDLEIQPGERVALIGPNGSGKTTLLRLLAGLLRPQAGAVSLAGTPLDRLGRAEIAHRVAVVPQETHVPFAFTVREVVAFGRTARRSFWGTSQGGDRDAVEQAIELTGLADLAGRAYQSLSGGERQRVILAMALAQETSILLLDEPTAHLDLRARVELLALVEQLAAARGTTVLAAVHDLSLASQFFGRVVVLDQGRKVADFSPPLGLHAEQLRAVFGVGLQILADRDGAEVVSYRPSERASRG
ncbi:MAG TPA: ABC transporter ATP-binding protein [Chloroflexota bacterium]|nr:ABC transporter ATP-binding protein [Chloroflexota bacterium]